MSSASSLTPRDHRLLCVVVTPERKLFEEPVEFVALPLFDGELGVLPGRAPLIGRLGFGELRTKDENQVSRYFIDGGFAQIRDNVVTVLTSRAIPANQIVAASVHEELERARAAASKTDVEHAEKTKAVLRARAQLRVSHRS